MSAPAPPTLYYRRGIFILSGRSPYVVAPQGVGIPPYPGLSREIQGSKLSIERSYSRHVNLGRLLCDRKLGNPETPWYSVKFPETGVRRP